MTVQPRSPRETDTLIAHEEPFNWFGEKCPTCPRVSVLPAYALEAVAFNPKEQPQNPYLRQIVPRIAALAAPILYGYQAVLYGAWILPDCCISGGWQCGLLSTRAQESLVNLVSSTLEIPQKLISGPNCSPNYLGANGNLRYNMIWQGCWRAK